MKIVSHFCPMPNDLNVAREDAIMKVDEINLGKGKARLYLDLL